MRYPILFPFYHKNNLWSKTLRTKLSIPPLEAGEFQKIFIENNIFLIIYYLHEFKAGLCAKFDVEEELFFHDSGDFGFRFLYLPFNKGNLFDQHFELECKAAFGKDNTKGMGCSSL